MKYYEIKEIARKLRLNPTPAEKLLWSYISDRKLEGRKFLRQHPIIYESYRNNHFFFIPDFYCRGEMLIIELDGQIHLKQRDRDRRRDMILKSMNLRVLRIQNEELQDIDLVLEKIKSFFKSAPPPCRQGGGRGWIIKIILLLSS
jgi:very-short-patch-repair endonuclease